jgi:hypothetical protein
MIFYVVGANAIRSESRLLDFLFERVHLFVFVRSQADCEPSSQTCSVARLCELRQRLLAKRDLMLGLVVGRS